MRWISTSLQVVLCIGAGIRAQAVSTVVAAQDLVVTSSDGGTQTFLAGPLPPSGLALTSLGNVAQSRIQLWPWDGTPGFPAGATGWALDGQISVSLGSLFGIPWGYGDASLSGSVLLTFSSPQPVDGVLYLLPYSRYLPQFQVFSGDLAVDLNLDGVPDYFASAQNGQGINFPVTLDANGRSMAIDFSLSGVAYSYYPSSPNSGGYAEALWDIVFLPGTYALEHYSTGCVPLTFGRDRWNGFAVGIGSSATSWTQTPIGAGVFLLGLGPQNVPLPFPPFCPVLVASPAIVPPDSYATSGIGLWPPDLPIPRGLQFYCQAVWVDAQGNVLTSDCIRNM